MNTWMRLVALILILITPTWGWAVIYDPFVSLRDIGPIKVSINDNAKGGCWTNVKEVKDYAEGKLEIAGADLSYTSDSMPRAGVRNTFRISVSGYRLNSGLCVGIMEIYLGGYQLSDATHEEGKVIGVLYFSEFDMQMQHPKNMNNQILDSVKEAIEEWEDRN